MTRHADVLKKDLQEVNRRLYFFLVKVKVKSLSRVRLFATPWTVAYQAPPSMGFSRQEYWSGLPFPSPGDLPNPESKPGPPVSPALAGEFFTTKPLGEPISNIGQLENKAAKGLFNHFDK